ncbi:MAG: alpha/beta fold hydrolase [Leptospirales bacterium]|nr:alpha/beta fold hydrolase [Leptospirales bacterium]
MSLAFLVAACLLLALLIGHYGLPEKALPMPPAPDPEHMLEGAAPWRFEGKSGIAFLVIHGYGGSPFNVRPLGEFLHSLGHTAIGPLLPGHGTRIEDLARTRFQHWESYIERMYLEERSRYRKLFLVGFSMGGAVALRIASRHADTFRPAGLITISSPVFFNGFFNGRLIFHQPTMPLTGLIKIFQPILRLERNRPGQVERLNPWVGYRYQHALAALHSFKRALPAVRAGLGRIHAPYCSIMAANDRTVSAENQAYIYNRIQSREKRALMFILPPDLSTMHTLLTHERARDRVFRFLQSFIDETLNADSAPRPAPKGWKFPRLRRGKLTAI